MFAQHGQEVSTLFFSAQLTNMATPPSLCLMQSNSLTGATASEGCVKEITVLTGIATGLNNRDLPPLHELHSIDTAVS